MLLATVGEGDLSLGLAFAWQKDPNAIGELGLAGVIQRLTYLVQLIHSPYVGNRGLPYLSVTPYSYSPFIHIFNIFSFITYSDYMSGTQDSHEVGIQNDF